jgi:putative copper resistance protein D
VDERTRHAPALSREESPIVMHDMPSMLPPLHWASFLRVWELRPGWDAFALVLLVGYGGGLVTCRRQGVRSVHPVRVVLFLLGVGLLVFTVSSAVNAYAMALFWDHMIEHLLLIMVVPMLLVLGHPLTLLRVAASTRGRAEAVDRVLRSGPVAVVTHPVFGVALYSIVIVATHLTSFMDVMATHAWVMGAEQVLYLVSGYLFLLPVLGNEPIRWHMPHLLRIALLLAAMTPDTVVGIVLMQTVSDIFPVMMGAHPAWAPAPLDDIHMAGGVMWAAGDGLMMFFAVGAVIALIASGDEKAAIGGWLQGVRRNTLTDAMSRGDATGATFDEQVDVDDDEAMLAAYNRMLARLNQDSRESHPPSR